MNRLNRRVLDAREARRIEAETDRIAAAWDASEAERRDLRPARYEEEESSTELRVLEDLYWRQIYGVHADHDSDGYDDSSSGSIGSGVDYLDFERVSVTDDGSLVSPYDDSDDQEEATRWYRDQKRAIDEAYVEWAHIETDEAVVDDPDNDDDGLAAARAFDKRAVYRFGLRLVPHDGKALRAPFRRPSRSWKDVEPVRKPWERKAS
ncbi:hypothetical protein EBS80_01845 [bacterium]|nr:hypothetical protein [bacterium]